MDKNLQFRADIEGLRAVAVLSVLAFHTGGANIFSGGFVGVDVFFVISGYLITQNILAQAEVGTFSIRTFYVRRARRLLPALFFTVTITLIVAFFSASPKDMQHIAESAIATTLSVSNFYFWGQSGYFDTAVIQKPLLHTWSLAVEEQFYLVWPVVLLLMVNLLRRRLHAIVALAFLGMLSVLGAEIMLDNDASGAFYLMPFRICEFVFGAICTLLPPARRLRRVLYEVFSLFGLALIIQAIFSYNDATRFPGVAALLPCLGTALLISFGRESIVQHLLANRLAVGIGHISYSLYLVHWPVFVFFRRWQGEELNMTQSAAVSVISLLLAIMMYRYVEQPFRLRREARASSISTPFFFKTFSSITAILLAISVLIWWGKGWPWRFPEALVRLASEADMEKKARFAPYRERCMAAKQNICLEPTDGVNVFILGDSHAPDAFNALISQYPDYHYVMESIGGCPPLAREDFNLLTVKHPNREACIARNERILYSEQLSRASMVVVNAVFSWYQPEHLERSISQIRKHTDAPIIVLGNYLFFEEDVPDMVIKQGSTVMNEQYEKRLAPHSLAFEKELQALSLKLGFTYVSKREMFCSGNTARDCPLMFGDKLFTYDLHHLSLEAAKYMGARLRADHDELFFNLKPLQKMVVQ